MIRGLISLRGFWNLMLAFYYIPFGELIKMNEPNTFFRKQWLNRKHSEYHPSPESPAKPQVAPEVNRQLIKQLQTAFLGPQTPSVNYPATRYPLVSAPVNWGPLMSTVSGQINPVVSYMPATSPGQNQQILSNMQTPTGIKNSEKWDVLSLHWKKSPSHHFFMLA